MAKAKMKTRRRKYVPPEERMARYWRKRAGLEYSDFDAILGVEPPKHLNVSRREPEYKISRGADGKEGSAVNTPIKELRSTIGFLIADGKPLSFEEYHLAVAFGFLLTELPYMEFFKKRWHETAGHRAYASRGDCRRCREERAEAKKTATPVCSAT